MKLHSRFLQLPLKFDAGLLAHEIASVGQSEWRPHPAGFAGNDFLPLISAYGDPANESFAGPMRPTPYLSSQRPYLMEVLGALGAVLGRTRLMRLSGHAEVSEHSDVNYYWREHMRVHVPIVTQPTVSFHCEDTVVHMAAGECWIFDTWSLHKVINDQTHSRIHLVVDTVGGEGMWRLMTLGRNPETPPPPDWSPQDIHPLGRAPNLVFESVNVPRVMSPWEMREHLSFLLDEVAPNQAAAQDVARVIVPFLHQWRALWAAYGDAEAALPLYQARIQKFASDLQAAGAHRLLLVNEVDFMQTIAGMVLSVAVTRPR